MVFCLDSSMETSQPPTDLGIPSRSIIAEIENANRLSDRCSRSSVEMSDDTEEMLVIHNTFLELCNIHGSTHTHADRFISAPAAFGISTPSPEKANTREETVRTNPPVRSEVVERVSEKLTTVMMRNIPTRTSVRLLLEVVSNTVGAPLIEIVDFLYLPIDFKTNKNLGYCFINFLSPSMATEFISKLDNQKYVFCNTSEKQLQVSYSNRQGYAKNLEVFTQTKMLDTWPDAYRPLANVRGQMVPISSDVLAEVLEGAERTKC
jgi:hypothetical protein